MRLTLADLGVLADTAERNGTVRAFPAVALQWAAGARAEIERLREVARDAAEAATKHQAEVLLLRAALEEIANGPNRLTDTVGEVLYRMRDIAKQALKA